jgi:hypothetical protein
MEFMVSMVSKATALHNPGRDIKNAKERSRGWLYDFVTE